MSPPSRRFKLEVHAAMLFALCAGLLLFACVELSSAPESSSALSGTVAQFAPGGIPGPPSDIVLPARIGPPPHVRVRIPPHAGPPVFLSSMVAVGTGLDFSCALRSDGVAFCWGENLRGQLGDGTSVASAVPVQVNSTVAFRRLFVGDEIACGLDAVGRAHCWGGNSSGQLGANIPAGTPSQIPVPIAQPLFHEMSLGLRSSCGMDTNGVPYCWGGNQFGELGVGLPVGQGTVAPLPVTNSVAVGLFTVNNGFVSTCGLGTANQVYCWGRDLGVFGNGTTSVAGSAVPVISASGLVFEHIEVGGLYACGLDAQGHAHCWGRNLVGELGNGTFAQTSTPIPTPAPVLGGLAFTFLDTDDTNRSFKNTCGLTSGGQAWCWGVNNFGQLGAPSSETCFSNMPCSTVPVPVSGSLQFSQISVGGDHICGLATHGGVHCWGANYVGQLGDGTLANRAAPVAVRF